MLLEILAFVLVEMIELWKFNYHRAFLFVLLFSLIFCTCSSLNHEGLALLKFRERIESDPFGALADWNDSVFVLNPCFWHGVECSFGNVVSLNLRDMCLKGTLAPELGKLTRVKSIVLRNNLFSGIIPVELANLKELETLDLGYNSFTGPVPYDLLSILSLSILLLDNNQLVNCVSPEICELQMVSETQTDERVMSRKRKSCKLSSRDRDVAQRKLLQISFLDKPKNFRTFLPPTEQRPASPPQEAPSQPPSVSPSLAPSSFPKGLSPPFVQSPAEIPVVHVNSSKRSNRRSLILYPIIGGVTLLLVLSTFVFFWKCNNLAVVRPWRTGLSGQLQRAFVTGVPKLKRSELETACEDFSNVIGSSSFSKLYKGTLSTGVEIAVMSISVSSAKDWSNDLEKQFREKIKTLSKTNHKNFVNLLGYCEEEVPFARMMVFEYAPNGTLFEHLHIKEAEHLDWTTRMRIVMGIAYCLEYMHEMTPPLALKNLNSKSIYLTEDYAAKVSDFCMLNNAEADNIEANPASNVYSFGVMLLEIVTGKLPYTAENSTIQDCTSPVTEMADPILNSFEVQQLERINEVIQLCINPDSRRRPGMIEVSVKLREVTSIGPDRAIPRLSPLWWAEILSAESN